MLLDSLLALTPMLIILILMLRFRWGAARAGPIGWFSAIIIAAWRFGAGLELLALAQAKAMLLTLDVLLIVWGAFLLYRVADEAGAIGVLGGNQSPRRFPPHESTPCFKEGVFKFLSEQIRS